MAKRNITITMTIEIDEAEIKPRSINVWLYQFLNKINNEYPLKSITYKNKTISITKLDDVKNLELKEKDNLAVKKNTINSQDNKIKQLRK